MISVESDMGGTDAGRLDMDPAPYMRWAKQHPPARFDLSGSNLLNCTVDDLPGAREALDIAGLNPDGYPPLLEAIAAHYRTATERIATASGAGGANFIALATLVRAGDDVLVERPAYDPILGALRFLGARIRRFERMREEDWALDADRIRAAITPATRLIVVTNPHNPTGVLTPAAVLDEVARAADDVGARVLVDEVYLDIAASGDDARPAATRSDTFVSINSLTKSYGLSGLRAGWVIAAPRVAEAVRRTRDFMDGSGSIPSDTLAVLAFSRLDHLARRARAIVEPNRALLEAFMAVRPDLAWVRPAGTVAFPWLRGIHDSRPFTDRLRRDHDTQVAPGHFFEAPAHFRIAFAGAPDTLEGGLAAIGAALDAG